MDKNTCLNCAIIIVVVILLLYLYPPTHAITARALPWVAIIGGGALVAVLLTSPAPPSDEYAGGAEFQDVPAAKVSGEIEGVLIPTAESPFDFPGAADGTHGCPCSEPTAPSPPDAAATGGRKDAPAEALPAPPGEEADGPVDTDDGSDADDGRAPADDERETERAVAAAGKSKTKKRVSWSDVGKKVNKGLDTAGKAAKTGLQLTEQGLDVAAKAAALVPE